MSIADAEHRLIMATLDALDGDKNRAAKMLGISAPTLFALPLADTAIHPPWLASH